MIRLVIHVWDFMIKDEVLPDERSFMRVIAAYCDINQVCLAELFAIKKDLRFAL